MSGKTSKLLRKYATAIGQPGDYRRFKRFWNKLPRVTRGQERIRTQAAIIRADQLTFYSVPF